MFNLPTARVYLLSLLLMACSSTPNRLSNAPLSAEPVESSLRDLVKIKLKQFYHDFGGTPYQFGGLTDQGMDCSGLVYRSYRQYLGWDIARSTQRQLTAGTAISRESLQPGDLLFFAPENRSMHVGIYYDDINGGRFMHASSSRGVILSYLDSPYWSQFYRQSRRVY